MKIFRTLGIAALIVSVSGVAASASQPGHTRLPTLQGRAVLPVATYAPGPPAGAYFGKQTINGIEFPLPSQPVQGFSALLAGRRPGEYLAMPDNGFGNKDNSRDFLIRAYFIRPDFKTSRGGSGTVTVDVTNPIRFRDTRNLIGFPIVNKDTKERLLTGADIDPESMQRARNGDLWVGEEFGPWLLHFDASGLLLEPPFRVPAALVGSASDTGYLESPASPFLVGANSVAGSRGFESLAITPDGRHLYAMLEGATVADTDKDRRYLLEFSIARRAFTGDVWEYRTQPTVTGAQQCCFMADLAALDQHRLVVIERDNGRGAPVPPAAATFSRGVYVIDLRRVEADGFLAKTRVVDLTAIADPNGVSLPAIHPGDVQLGDPFGVACESIEAIHVVDGTRLLLGCDNNFPNTGRHPVLADDNELIVVNVPGLTSRR